MKTTSERIKSSTFFSSQISLFLQNIYPGNEVRLGWRTVNKTAITGKDFMGGEGELVFKTGEMAKDLMITIIDDMSANGKEEFFEVELVSISEGARLGGVKRSRVTIADDEEFQAGGIFCTMH